LITCPQAVDAAESGEQVEIDLEHSLIRLQGVEYAFPPLSPSALAILESGGLIPYLRKKLSITGDELSTQVEQDTRGRLR